MATLAPASASYGTGRSYGTRVTAVPEYIFMRVISSASFNFVIVGSIIAVFVAAKFRLVQPAISVMPLGIGLIDIFPKRQAYIFFEISFLRLR